MVESKPFHRISVHHALGGGSVADVLLWRKWSVSIAMLVSATSFWYLFERAGYNFLTFIANVMLVLVVILFLWAKSATLLNRPLPPLPNLEISQSAVIRTADEMQVCINHALSIAHEITIGRNLKLFLKAATGLWFLSYIGNLLDFLTLTYTGILFSFTVPLLFDKFQDHINDKLRQVHRSALLQYRKIDDKIVRKIPIPSNKEKKSE